LTVYEILEVVYSPIKAYKKIVQNPSFVGPLIVMVLFIIASLGNEFARASNFHVQQTEPSFLNPYDPDPWTENCSLWVSNGNVNCSTDDLVLGYNSVRAEIRNEIQLWMEIVDIGEVNCSRIDGYANVTFALKWLHPKSQPRNASLHLFSNYSSEYFYRDLTDYINQTKNDEWNNLTIPLEADASQWIQSSDQSVWKSITGLRLELMWEESDRSNITLLIDKLFFRSETFLPITGAVMDNLVTLLINTLVGFPFYWILFSFVLFIVSKVFRVVSELKMFLVIVGYALIAMVFMEVLFAGFYLVVNPLYFTIEAASPDSLLNTMFLFSFFVTILLPIWSMMLSVVGIRTAFELSWVKSVIIGVIGFLPYYIMLFLA
jgi:hypothetical protein